MGARVSGRGRRRRRRLLAHGSTHRAVRQRRCRDLRASRPGAWTTRHQLRRCLLRAARVAHRGRAGHVGSSGHQQTRRRARGRPAPLAAGGRGGRRWRAGAAAPRVSGAPARRVACPRRHAAGPALPVRRRVARALRRRGAAQLRGVVPGVGRGHWREARRHRRAGAALRRLQAGLRDSARQIGGGVHGGDCRVPAPHAGAHPAAGRRDLHRGLREGQAVERLQLVSRELQEPDRGEHRPAGVHRPRHRPGVPRGLPRAPRLQRAAREAPGARSRLAGVFRLSALLAAVVDRRRHGQLRHPGGVQ